jgi:hypothetical protein
MPDQESPLKKARSLLGGALRTANTTDHPPKLEPVSTGCDKLDSLIGGIDAVCTGYPRDKLTAILTFPEDHDPVFEAVVRSVAQKPVILTHRPELADTFSDFTVIAEQGREELLAELWKTLAKDTLLILDDLSLGRKGPDATWVANTWSRLLPKLKARTVKLGGTLIAFGRLAPTNMEEVGARFRALGGMSWKAYPQLRIRFEPQDEAGFYTATMDKNKLSSSQGDETTVAIKDGRFV